MNEDDPGIAAAIQRHINALHPTTLGEWPIRVCKEELNSLPLHSNYLYIWAIRPDGTLLRLDHEAFGHPVEAETDALTRFAVISNGARRYPELGALIPPPPAGVQPCPLCNATGFAPDETLGRALCARCAGMGWTRI